MTCELFLRPCPPRNNTKAASKQLSRPLTFLRTAWRLHACAHGSPLNTSIVNVKLHQGCDIARLIDSIEILSETSGVIGMKQKSHNQHIRLCLDPGRAFAGEADIRDGESAPCLARDMPCDKVIPPSLACPTR
eukprot:9503839-Pyramimonas_sp.AAC.1